MAIPHPYTPDVTWRIAVSGRFHVPRAEQIYRDFILPVISEEGLVMECSLPMMLPPRKSSGSAA